MTRTQKIFLYGGAIAVLLILNVWRFLAGPDDTPRQLSERTPQAIALPDLEFDLAGQSSGDQEWRDIFRSIELPPEPEPEPEPLPEPEPAPAPDPMDEAVARANRALDGISVIGILGSDDNRVAVIKKEGSLATVSVGEQLIPGFLIKTIDPNGIVVASGGLRIERRIEIGVE